MVEEGKMMKVEKGEYGYVLEDVPHLSDYIPDLPVSISPLLGMFCLIWYIFLRVHVIRDIYWYVINIL